MSGRKVGEVRGADPAELARQVKVLKPKAPVTLKVPLSPLEAMKEEGKRLFLLAKYAAAAEAYTQAIVRIRCLLWCCA